MRILGLCALLTGGAMLHHGFFGVPGRHPGHVVDLSLLDQQAALATAGGALCVVGAVLLVGAALAQRLDRLWEATASRAAPPGPAAGGSPAGSSDAGSDEGEEEAYSSHGWADVGKRTWTMRPAGAVAGSPVHG